MKLIPLGDRVLVERQAAEEKTVGGILLPDNAKEKPQIGLVQAVGEGKPGKDGKKRPLQVKPGDKVYFSSWAGEDYKPAGENLIVMREEDIMAIIEG
jgi:chaperonin GroES